MFMKLQKNRPTNRDIDHAYKDFLELTGQRSVQIFISCHSHGRDFIAWCILLQYVG